MPLSQGQKTAINEILNGENGLNSKVNKICEAREDCLALMRIDGDVADADCLIVLGKAKLKARTAASELVTLLS